MLFSFHYVQSKTAKLVGFLSFYFKNLLYYNEVISIFLYSLNFNNNCHKDEINTWEVKKANSETSAQSHP